MAVEALRFACGSEQWRRERLWSRLRPDSTELAQARAALAEHDWSRADAALRSHFLRRAPRFLIHPAARDDVARAVHDLFPSAVENAVRRADQLGAGRYDLLGYRGLSFRHGGTEVDWHRDPVHGRRAPVRFWARVAYLDPQCGDHKIIWELNRHQHWLAFGRAAWLTGDRRYTAAVEAELKSWLDANPPLTGINWSSALELGLRSISWIWTLHFLASFEQNGETTCLVDLLLGLERQLDHVAGHLSFYFSPNTHLLGEGLSLYVGGRVLPELRRAAHWEQIGRAILIREAPAQVRADGGHAERSTHYHRYALDFYLLALAVARHTNDGAAGEFETTVSRLASFCRALADESGRLPTIGDDDGGLLFPICGRAPADASDSLWLAAALLDRPELAVGDPPEEALWMLGRDHVRRVRPCPRGVPTSQIFRASGYGVLRSSGGHAILDAGPHGFINGGHAHAGALSLVLSLSGRPLLIDPGTATYTTDGELRNRFRSTAMHNTVVIDRRPQAVPAGPFHWETRVEARVDVWRPGLRGVSADHVGAVEESDGSPLDYVEAVHDGYLPLIHRRAVLRMPDGLWLIADHILGTGHHQADAYWHLDPAWFLEEASASHTRLTHQDGFRAAIASSASERRTYYGGTEGLGWCAPVYGQIVPSCTLRFSTGGEAPLSLVTAIAAAPASVSLSLECAPVTSERADGWHRAAVHVQYGRWRRAGGVCRAATR